MRKFNHYTILKVVVYGYITLASLGIIGLIVIGLISVAFPIVNAVKASHGETPRYPLSLNFIS